MKLGQIINGYTIMGVEHKAFSTKGSGLSVWTFVRKAGMDYFMKEFLSPTYPLDASPGSATVKEKKRAKCQEFERRHKSLITKVAETVLPGGNLIYTLDFFRYNAKYYKVTAKVNASSISVEEIATLPLLRKLVILKGIVDSLNILHGLNIIHGDLKPTNILIEKTAVGTYTPKLIDFDNCFYSGVPPSNRDEVVGDPTYYSPELEDYIMDLSQIDGVHLTCKSDIFALGIIFCQYITGKLPNGIPVDKYASHVVNNGVVIEISNESLLPDELANIINLMLLKDYRCRPSIVEISNVINGLVIAYKGHDYSDEHRAKLEVAIEDPKAISLKGTMMELNGEKKPSRLKINMGRPRSL